MPSPSRRQRIAAIAATADYNPAEAAVAQSILDGMPRDLDAIAADIKAEVGRNIDSQFAIGRLLSEAYATFDGDDNRYGAWYKAQEFPFGQYVAYRYRLGAERETEVRAYLSARAQSVTQGPEMGVVTAVRRLMEKPKPAPAKVGIPEPADPAFTAFRAGAYAVLGWEVGPDGNGARTRNAFLSMHVDDLAESAGLLKAIVDAYQEARAAR